MTPSYQSKPCCETGRQWWDTLAARADASPARSLTLIAICSSLASWWSTWFFFMVFMLIFSCLFQPSKTLLPGAFIEVFSHPHHWGQVREDHACDWNTTVMWSVVARHEWRAVKLAGENKPNLAPNRSNNDLFGHNKIKKTSIDTMNHKKLIPQTTNCYVIYGGSNLCLVSQLGICTLWSCTSDETTQGQMACQGNGPPLHMLSIPVRSQPHHTTHASYQTTEDIWDRRRGQARRVLWTLSI